MSETEIKAIGSHETGHAVVPKMTVGLKLRDYVPTWMTSNLYSSRSWKTWFRCWVAAWLVFILLIPHHSITALGSTAFFGMIISAILPPFVPFPMFFFLAFTMFIGQLFAWGMGSAAMRAALAVRSQVLLAKDLQKVEQSAAGLANPEALFDDSVFRGEFLDVRSSVMYGVFLAITTFILALVRAYQPKLVFGVLFGTIAIDIICCYGPLFPVPEYSLLDSMFKSTAAYVAIAFAVTILIFPASMNHVSLDMTSEVLQAIIDLIKLQDEVLSANLDDLGPEKPLMNQAVSRRANIIGGLKKLTSFSGFINLEFSVGKWNGDDVKSLQDPLLALATRAIALQSFLRVVGSGAADLDPTSHNIDSDSTTSAAVTADTKDSYVLRQLQRRGTIFEQENNLTMQVLLSKLDEATRELRIACLEAVAVIQATVNCVNHNRWWNNSSLSARCSAELGLVTERLEKAFTEFTEKKRFVLLDPFLPFIRDISPEEADQILPLRNLYLSYVFASNLVGVAQSILPFLEQVREITDKRKCNRLWAPTELRALANLARQRGDSENIGDEPLPQEDAAEEEDEAKYRRDPDSRPPKNFMQWFGNMLYNLWQWTSTTEALFVFKYVVVSVATWLPAVFPHSANFFYKERGVWAVIMAQLTVTLYASEQVLSYVERFLGTFIGLIFALLTWYIGDGNGYNAYGLAASGALWLAPMVWLRLYVPAAHMQSSILIGATWALVVGYSQVDELLPQYDSPGLGWPVAWKRWMTVVIGSAASFVLMFIPPVSGRKAVRMRNGYVIKGLSNTYSYLISRWIAHGSRQISDDDRIPSQWIDDFRLRLVSLADEITSVRDMTHMAKWEGSLRGEWPSKEYRRLIDAETTVLVALALLGGSLIQLTDDWRTAFLHDNKVLNPNFVSDVMSIFSLVSQSLRNGEPMHQVFPQTLMDRLFYHSHSAAYKPTSASERKLIHADEVKSVDFMYYASGVVAVYEILQSLDEIHQITRDLCGEVPLKGFDRWKRLYEPKP